MTTTSICHTCTCIFIGFIRCTKIFINIDSLPSVPPSLYRFFLQSNVFRSTSRSGLNQMWILKNSKELKEHLKSSNFNHITSTKSFNFSTLYTPIPHDKLKTDSLVLFGIPSFSKNGNRRYNNIIISSFGSRRSILCEGTLWLQKQVLCRWHHQDTWVSGRQHFRGFVGKVLRQIVGISLYKLCPSSSQHIPLLIWNTISVQFHIQVHR